MTVIPAALSLGLSLLVLASIWSWAYALRQLFARQPLLAYEPRTRPPWNLIDICLMFLVWIVLQLAVAGMLSGGEPGSGESAANPPVESPPAVESQRAVESPPAVESPRALSVDSATLRWAIVLSGVANLLVCALGGLLIVVRTGARWDLDLGLTLRHAGRDVAYGIIAFAMLAPIIYVIQLILVQFHPSEHPLVESFRTNPTLGFYLVCVFSAAIAAPLFEEFVCRVLLQGLFERVAVSSSLEEALFANEPHDAPPSDLALPSDAELKIGAELEFGADALTAVPAGVVEVEAGNASGSTVRVAEAVGWRRGGIPILLSSLVFAGLHWGNGLDPIPLFFLAIGLGYLYQRTHRMLPCVVVHFLVNALALAMLAISLFVE